MNGYAWMDETAAYRRGFIYHTAQYGNPYSEGTVEHSDFYRGQEDHKRMDREEEARYHHHCGLDYEDN